jgi:DNA-binding LacI/PurR family transcriptional regulator
MSTIRDVARKAQVSIATVSRVLNNSEHRVNAETRTRVLAAISELDYSPNAFAKSLSTQQARTVEVIIPDVSNPYYAQLVRGVQDAADESGYTVVLHNTDQNSVKVKGALRLLRERLVDGVIFGGGVIPAKEVEKIVGDRIDRAVVIGRQDIALPAVRIDNIEPTADIVRHLVSLGHNRIGFVNGPFESNTMQDRLVGYQRGLEAYGLELDQDLVNWGPLALDQGYHRGGVLLDRVDKRPTAIIAGNDQLAVGVLRAAEDRNLRTPSQLAVVGFDNTPLSRFYRPSITTIDIPRYRLGHTAMNLLLDRMKGKAVPEVTWLATRLMVRGSTVEEPFWRT